ncbi:MAG: aspartate aminotransferase family protein [Woeseiaceae bacterium]|nr:aspartate aminotransferase family protein [Woeseiaceae bacterium]
MANSNIDLWDRYGDRLIPIMPFMDNVITSAEGSWMTDADGRRILDLAAGQFCNILGHSHPEFTQRLQDALPKCLHTGSQFVTDSVLATTEKIAAITPGNLNNSILLSTGTEANEFAIRVAKTFTNRTGIVGYDRGYYGISLATRSLSTISEGHVDFSPKVPETYYLLAPTGDQCPPGLDRKAQEMWSLELSQRLIGEAFENVAAVIVETIISAGGMIYPSAQYLQALKKMANDAGALLIVDEAQTGFGRCGEWFDCQNLEVQPDILVFSKTSGNGYPSSGVVISDAIKSKLLERGFYHLSSHQNDPVTATAVSAVIDIVRENDYRKMCKDNGEYFVAQLRELATRHPNLADVRGRGLMIAFELRTDDEERRPYLEMLTPFILACKEKNVHLTFSYYEGAIRIIPAINIERDDIDFALNVLDEVLTDLENGKIDAKRVAQKNKVIRESLKTRKVKRTLNRLWETSPKYWVRKILGS